MAFDKYSELDPAKMQRDIEEMHGSAFFDKYAVLDDHHRVAQIEQAFGVEISNDALLDPTLLMQEVVIADSGGGGIAPDWVPDNAKIAIDFVNNVAWTEADGEVAVSELVTTSPTLTANGLELRVGDTVDQIGGALLAALLTTTYTVVVYFKPIGAFAAPLCVNDATDSVENPLISTANDGVIVSSYDNNWFFNFENVVVASATCKVAYTRDGSFEASAVNGNAAQTNNDVPVPLDPLPTRALIGSFDDSYVFLARDELDLYSITIYDAVTDTTGLSELSEV